MSLSSIYNLGSLLLGLVAWSLPIVAIYGKRKEIGGRMRLMAASFTAAAASLCLQLFEVLNRVSISDWSALLDTMSFVCRVAVFMLAVTVLLNVFLLAACREEQAKNAADRA